MPLLTMKCAQVPMARRPLASRPAGARQPWHRAVVYATTEIKMALRLSETPIGPNNTAIARVVIAEEAILVTGIEGKFERMQGLVLEDWAK